MNGDEEIDEEESEEDEEESEEDSKPVKQTKKVLGETKPLSDEAIAEYNAKLKNTGVVRCFSLHMIVGVFKLYSSLYELVVYYEIIG